MTNPVHHQHQSDATVQQHQRQQEDDCCCYRRSAPNDTNNVDKSENDDDATSTTISPTGVLDRNVFVLPPLSSLKPSASFHRGASFLSIQYSYDDDDHHYCTNGDNEEEDDDDDDTNSSNVCEEDFDDEDSDDEHYDDQDDDDDDDSCTISITSLATCPSRDDDGENDNDDDDTTEVQLLYSSSTSNSHPSTRTSRTKVSSQHQQQSRHVQFGNVVIRVHEVIVSVSDSHRCCYSESCCCCGTVSTSPQRQESNSVKDESCSCGCGCDANGCCCVLRHRTTIELDWSHPTKDRIINLYEYEYYKHRSTSYNRQHPISPQRRRCSLPSPTAVSLPHLTNAASSLSIGNEVTEIQSLNTCPITSSNNNDDVKAVDSESDLPVVDVKEIFSYAATSSMLKLSSDSKNDVATKNILLSSSFSPLCCESSTVPYPVITYPSVTSASLLQIIRHPHCPAPSAA